MKRGTEKKRKTVTWARDVSVPQQEQRLSHKKARLHSSPNYDRLWMHIFNRIQRSEWEGIEQELTIRKTDKENFFLNKGSCIFEQAFYYKDTSVLSFILDYIPINCAQKVLKEESYSILKNFLKLQQALEKLGWYNDTQKERRIDKLKVLLKIDKEGVEKAFEEHKAEPPYCHEGVQNEYAEASKELAEKPKLSFKM